MKPLTNLLIEFENKFNEIFQELRDLKMRAYALEDENEKLRKELTDVYRHCLAEGAGKTGQPQQSRRQGFANLSRLYNDGFHVCHMHFGQSRSGDCLFCLGFLGKK